MSLNVTGRLAAVVVAGALTASCASVTYDDPSGAKHIVGFANVTVTPPKTSFDPSVVSVTTFGLALRMSSSRQNGAVTLGYDKQTILDMPTSACVDLGAAGPCAALSNSTPVAASGRASGATQ